MRLGGSWIFKDDCFGVNSSRESGKACLNKIESWGFHVHKR